jgi:hypothetical protein
MGLEEFKKKKFKKRPCSVAYILILAPQQAEIRRIAA